MYQKFEVVSRENNEALRMVSKGINVLQEDMTLRAQPFHSRPKEAEFLIGEAVKLLSRPVTTRHYVSLWQKREQLEGDIAPLRATMVLAKDRKQKEIKHQPKMDEVQRKKMALEENFQIKQELVKKEAQMIASITPFFFVVTMFFQPRLNIFIFLPTLGCKYSFIVLQL